MEKRIKNIIEKKLSVNQYHSLIELNNTREQIQKLNCEIEITRKKIENLFRIKIKSNCSSNAFKLAAIDSLLLKRKIELEMLRKTEKKNQSKLTKALEKEEVERSNLEKALKAKKALKKIKEGK